MEPVPIDMGALAQTLRSRASASVVVLWWAIFAILVFACVKPNPVTVSVVWLFVVVFVIVREIRRRLYLRNLAGLPCFSRTAAVEPRSDWPKVAVFSPARNEEDEIDVAARSLATLNYPNLDLWFINDHSTDRTREILDAVQRDFPRVHVIHDPPLTEGWFGKSNAIWQAFVQMEQERGEAEAAPDQTWLLFTDGDIVFKPGIIEQAIAVVERDRLDYLTCVPHMLCKTWSEQFLLPSGWRGIIQGAEYERLNDPRSFPIGIGAFMLVRYSCYQAFGGHKALARWHPEDTLMAAAVKYIGDRVGAAWTPDLLYVRFYHGYSEVKRHTLRKMRIFFGDRLHLPLTMLALRLSTMLMALPMMAIGTLPQLIAGRFDLVHTLLAVAGLVLYLDEACEYRGVEHIADFKPIVPWLHPISGALRVWFALSIMGQIIGKHRMEWRGRHEFGTTDFSPKPPSTL